MTEHIPFVPWFLKKYEHINVRYVRVMINKIRPLSTSTTRMSFRKFVSEVITYIPLVISEFSKVRISGLSLKNGVYCGDKLLIRTDPNL